MFRANIERFYGSQSRPLVVYKRWYLDEIMRWDFLYYRTRLIKHRDLVSILNNVYDVRNGLKKLLLKIGCIL